MKARQPWEEDPERDTPANSGRSIAQLLQEIISRVGEIVYSECRLAATEVKLDLAKRAKSAVWMTIAAALLLLGLGFVLLGAAFLLAETMPLWLASISVGAVTGIAGAILLYAGLAKMKQTLKLEMTTKTAKENIRWLRNR
jgi:hypothetical protein